MDFYTRSRNYQRISGKQQGGEDYYIMPCELAARGFEGVCLYLLQSAGHCSDFLVNLQSWQDFERDDAGHRRDCYPYPSEAEAAALLPYYMKFFRALFGRCEVSQKAAEGVAAATLQAAEEKAEADRLAAEKAEQERKAAEAIRAARRAEQEQKAAEVRAKAEQTRAAIVNRLTAAHFDTIATGFDSVAVYFAANMQGEIFTGSVDIKTTEAEAVAAAQAAPLARVQYKRVHNAKRIICRRWKVAEVRANKYTAAEVLAELDGAEVRTIARTFADFEKAETWNDAAHLWDDTQRAHEEKIARARQAAQERTAANEPTDSKAESKQGATISDPRAAGLQLVTIAEGVAVVGAAEDERTRGRQTWKARRDIKAHGCTWNKRARQWEATTAEAAAAVRAWFGESYAQSASEGAEAPAAVADIESQDNTADTLQDAGEITEAAAAELTPVYYSASEKLQTVESEPAAIAASDEQGAPVIDTPKIEEIATDEILTQWQTIKEKHPDRLLLLRCGDCYALYQDDAEKVAELLGLTIQTTASGYKVAAFPHYDISYKLPRLIRAGHRVAICDQLEAPKQKTVTRGCIEQTKEQTEEPTEQGAPLTEPNRDGLPDWLHVGTRFCLLDFVTGEPTAVRYTCAAIDYEARTVTIPEAADTFRGGSHVYRWDAFHWNTFAPVNDDTDPTPEPSGEGEGVCHSYETGAPCYSTSEKLRNSESKERDTFNLPSRDERRPSAKLKTAHEEQKRTFGQAFDAAYYRDVLASLTGKKKVFHFGTPADTVRLEVMRECEGYWRISMKRGESSDVEYFHEYIDWETILNTTRAADFLSELRADHTKAHPYKLGDLVRVIDERWGQVNGHVGRITRVVLKNRLVGSYYTVDFTDDLPKFNDGQPMKENNFEPLDIEPAA